jgi:pimeloyl-[acyl-carrier protein] methyl ester esterase
MGAAELHHEDLGRGPPVVLVHGWSWSSLALEGEAAALAARRRAIVPDLRGHGRSPPGAFTLADLAGDLVALLERLGLEGAVLAGWSLGAQVVLAALPRLGRRVSAAVLVDGTPRFTAGEDWPHGLPAQQVEVLAHRTRRDPARAIARFQDATFADGELDLSGRRRVEALRARVPLPDPAAAQAGLEVLAREDLRPSLGALDLPVLLLHGERDAICPPGASLAMARAIPGARAVLLPGLGHAPFLSRPGVLAEAVLSLGAGGA